MTVKDILLAEYDHEMGTTRRLLERIPDDKLACMISEAGWDIPLYQGGKEWMLPIPAVFVVRADGTIAARHIDPDYRQRMEIDSLVRAVEMLG